MFYRLCSCHSHLDAVSVILGAPFFQLPVKGGGLGCFTPHDMNLQSVTVIFRQ